MRRVIFLVCVLCTVPIIAEETDFAEVAKKLTNLVKVGVEAGEGIKAIQARNTRNSNLDVAKNILDAVAAALGSYGEILSAISSLLVLFKEEEPSDRDVMLQQFQHVQLRFDAIHNELREMKQLIGEIPEKVELHARITRIEVLILAAQRLQRSPMTELPDFRIKCDNNSPDETLDYIFIHHDAIKRSVARQYNRVDVLRTMQTLGIIQLNALKMYEMCQGSKSVDLPARQRNQYVNDKKRNVEEFRRNINTVMQAFYDAEDHIFRSFFKEYAKNEITQFVAKHTNLNYSRLGSELYGMLTTKYYWRHFAVGVYSGEIISFKEHYYSTNSDYSLYRFRENERSWFVILSQYEEDENEKEKFKSGALGCIERLQSAWPTSVQHLVDIMGCEIIGKDYYYPAFLAGNYTYVQNMKDCIEPYGYVNLVCIKHGNDLSWFVSNDASLVNEEVEVRLDSTKGLSIVVAH